MFSQKFSTILLLAMVSVTWRSRNDTGTARRHRYRERDDADGELKLSTQSEPDYRDRWQKCLTVLMEEEKRKLQGSHHIAPANPGPSNRASFSGRQCVTSHLVYATMSKQYQFKLVLLGQFLLSESLIPLRSFKVNQQLENLGTLYTILHVTRLTLHQPCPPFRQGPVR